MFYNEAAGAMLGISFEETGAHAGRASGARRSGRSTSDGTRSRSRSCRDQGPAHGAAAHTATFTVRSAQGESYEIESTALPIVAEGGQEGAMIFFWPGRTTGRG